MDILRRGNKNLFFRFQTVNANLSCFGSIFTAHPDYLEARLLLAVLNAENLSHVDAINSNQLGALPGNVQRSGMLHEGFSMAVQSPHLHFQTDFYTWFAAPAHEDLFSFS